MQLKNQVDCFQVKCRRIALRPTIDDLKGSRSEASSLSEAEAPEKVKPVEVQKRSKRSASRFYQRVAAHTPPLQAHYYHHAAVSHALPPLYYHAAVGQPTPPQHFYHAVPPPVAIAQPPPPPQYLHTASLPPPPPPSHYYPQGGYYYAPTTPQVHPQAHPQAYYGHAPPPTVDFAFAPDFSDSDDDVRKSDFSRHHHG